MLNVAFKSTVELQSYYLTELAFNLDMSNLIYLNVAFYLHLIRQLDYMHLQCDV